MKMRNVFAGLIAALSIGIGVTLAVNPEAFAQQRPSARVNTTQQVHFYRKTINFNDAFAAGNTSIRFGRLPSNASILRYNVDVRTAFVGGGTNRIVLGAGNFANAGPAATLSAANYVLAQATDGGITTGVGTTWTAGTVGLATILTGANFGTRLTSAGEVDLWANYTCGTTCTAGQATFTIEYIPDTDL